MRRMLRTRAGIGLVVMVTVVCLLAPVRARALRSHGDGGDDRFGVFSQIVVTEDRPAGDVACLFCTVRVDGDVHGDVAVLFSTVVVSDGRTISGDVATVFSTLVVGEGSRINGDLATVFGTASLAESAHVGGDRAVLASGLGLTVILAPLLIAVGLIWLLVWVIRRMTV